MSDELSHLVSAWKYIEQAAEKLQPLPDDTMDGILSASDSLVKEIVSAPIQGASDIARKLEFVAARVDRNHLTSGDVALLKHLADELEAMVQSNEAELRRVLSIA